jgi:50S ribosomal subunit-associated GTPase HflX
MSSKDGETACNPLGPKQLSGHCTEREREGGKIGEEGQGKRQKERERRSNRKLVRRRRKK